MRKMKKLVSYLILLAIPVAIAAGLFVFNGSGYRLSEQDAADNADFSGIGKSTMGNISIGEVIHKTKIEVNEKGTKAGAAALVELVDEGCVIAEKQVILNRPFMYMILDNETMLPLFAGIYTGV